MSVIAAAEEGLLVMSLSRAKAIATDGYRWNFSYLLEGDFGPSVESGIEYKLAAGYYRLHGQRLRNQPSRPLLNHCP